MRMSVSWYKMILGRSCCRQFCIWFTTPLMLRLLLLLLWLLKLNFRWDASLFFLSPRFSSVLCFRVSYHVHNCIYIVKSAKASCDIGLFHSGSIRVSSWKFALLLTNILIKPQPTMESPFFLPRASHPKKVAVVRLNSTVEAKELQYRYLHPPTAKWKVILDPCSNVLRFTRVWYN